MKRSLSAPFPLVSNFAMLSIPSTSTEAIYRLRTYEPHLALSRLQALELLEDRLTTYRLLALYQTFFPDQFAASTRSIYPVGERHSDREVEFLQLLAKHCFPVSFWTIEQAYESRIEAIPVLDMGIDWHQEDALELLKDEWKILIPLTLEGRYWFESVDHDCVEWYEAEFGISFDRIRHPDQVPPKLLRQRCMKAGSPLSFCLCSLRCWISPLAMYGWTRLKMKLSTVLTVILSFLGQRILFAISLGSGDRQRSSLAVVVASPTG